VLLVTAGRWPVGGDPVYSLRSSGELVEFYAGRYRWYQSKVWLVAQLCRKPESSGVKSAAGCIVSDVVSRGL
jgi:hypothetical protein